MQRSLATLHELLRRHRFNFASEDELQAGIEQVLVAVKLVYLREYRLEPHGRIDFYFPPSRIGIEVKVKGSPSAVTRQVLGYAQHAEIDGLLLVTSRLTLTLPETLNGKPVSVLPLWVQGF